MGCCRIFYFFLDERGVVLRHFVESPDRRGPQVVISSIKGHIESEIRDPYEWKSEAGVPSDENI
jgi:hypothetical protein